MFCGLEAQGPSIEISGKTQRFREIKNILVEGQQGGNGPVAWLLLARGELWGGARLLALSERKL